MNISTNRLTRGDVLTKSIAKHFNLDAFATDKFKRSLLQVCNCVAASLCLSLLAASDAIAADFSFTQIADSLNFSPRGLNNNGQIAFSALLGNGTRGVYRAQAGAETPQPEPLPSVENAFSLSKIVDTNTPILKAIDNINSLNLLNFDGDNVFFRVSSGQQQGIYKVSNGIIEAIADQNTTIPGGNGTFTFFGTISINSDNVVFSGSGVNQQQGIYIKRGDTPVSVVVDKNTPIPNGTGNFSGFSLVTANKNHVVFTGIGASGERGIYISRNGVLQVLVDTNTSIPGGTGNFTSFSNIVVDENNVVFIASGASGQQGIYISRDGTLQVLVDTNIPIPGGTGNFSSFNDFVVDENNLVFRGRGASGQQGIYISRNGVLQVLIDSNTSIPNGTGNFSSFDNFVVDENNLVFRASGASGQQGIYISRDGVLQVLVDTKTPIPGGTGNFRDFSNLFLTTNGRNVIFRTTSVANQRNGIYISRDGVLQVLVDSNTNIPGSLSKFGDIGNSIIDGDNVAFVGRSNNINFGISNTINFGIYALIGDRLLKVVNLDSRIDGKRISGLGDLRLNGNSLVFLATLSDGTRSLLRADLITNK
ncbi:DUF7453 family protein [Iningainema tapete]|uniref:Uncharacterized protein n=1 Tax=Iningainema tapete BLCC-T55 TaxID=2748662 RepID=A0A8J7BZW6_9CYAN|nr:choice-of-anchor tandem repeat NxxGxxAF-containing protein [Iningainema tapete]MBD2776868.1 hypothetical protein [Iningainema tapete BLCC-T55]